MFVFTNSTRATLTSSMRLRGKPRQPQHNNYKIEVFFLLDLGVHGCIAGVQGLEGQCVKLASK